MTSTLLQAIKNKWYSSQALTTLVPNGLYLSQVPDTKEDGTREDLPYATCDSDRTRFEFTQSQISHEITTVTFRCWTAGSMNNLEEILQAIRSCFDWQSLTFADGVSSSVYIQPLSFEYDSEPVRYRDTSIVYRVTMRYEVWISKPFPFYPNP